MNKNNIFYIKKIKKKSFELLFIIILLIIVSLIFHISSGKNNKPKYILNWQVFYNESYRNPDISKKLLNDIAQKSKDINASPEEIMTLALIVNKYSYENLTDWLDNKLKTEEDYKSYYNSILKSNINNKDFKTIYSTMISISKAYINDFIYFPIALNKSGNSNIYSFSDSWMGKRTYKGERKHEGTDIMTKENIRNYYPVVSVSDGIIENMGWLELGGYRIGIRTLNGLYIYYAHLSSYDDSISKGMEVKAGQIIGYVGDTGYSKVEGTTGNFKVHLHMGIYFNKNNEEISVNPYSILRLLEEKYKKTDY